MNRGCILLVDDEAALTRVYARWLTSAGFTVEVAHGGVIAAELVSQGGYDAVVSDIIMPDMGGIELLRAIRQHEHDLDVPVVLVTAVPSIETATEAVTLGALRYLIKPLTKNDLVPVIEQAVQLRKLAQLKRDAMRLAGTENQPGDRIALEQAFDRALAGLWLAFQPIVSIKEKRIFGYEALMRTREPALPNPGAMLEAAERLGQLSKLGREIRGQAAEACKMLAPDVLLFINLHPEDLMDPTLFSDRSLVDSCPDRVVLELTERATLDKVVGIRERVARLRGLGYRIAIDDLGAGYAGLAAFASLEPDIVKIDMSLIRGIENTKAKRAVVGSLVEICGSLNMKVIAEGVETAVEHDTLVTLGCDLLQGYYFAKPAALFAVPSGFRA